MHTGAEVLSPTGFPRCQAVSSWAAFLRCRAGVGEYDDGIVHLCRLHWLGVCRRGSRARRSRPRAPLVLLVVRRSEQHKSRRAAAGLAIAHVATRRSCGVGPVAAGGIGDSQKRLPYLGWAIADPWRQLRRGGIDLVEPSSRTACCPPCRVRAGAPTPGTAYRYVPGQRLGLVFGGALCGC
jgi:hypothetical protein